MWQRISILPKSKLFPHLQLLLVYWLGFYFFIAKNSKQIHGFNDSNTSMWPPPCAMSASMQLSMLTQMHLKLSSLTCRHTLWSSHRQSVWLVHKFGQKIVKGVPAGGVSGPSIELLWPSDSLEWWWPWTSQWRRWKMTPRSAVATRAVHATCIVLRRP